MASIPVVVGKIEGITSTDSFSMIITDERIGRNDYVEVIHEDKPFLLLIKEVKRSGDKLFANCIVVGPSPKTPFQPGSQVYAASHETVRRGLGLVITEVEGLYIGKLKSRDLMVWLPVKKLTRVFIVGKPGAGKSYTMGVIAEELIKKGVPLVIIDAHGEYSSLKVPAESPSSEFKVEPKSYSEQIIEFADMIFNPGADIDISALENAKPEDLVCQMQCTIINLRGLSTQEQYSVVSRLLNKLLGSVMVMQVPPFYLVLDEAHLFAGRSRQNEPLVKETFEAVRRFAQEGRKFGANLIVLTQRPQLLDMTVRSLSATWIIHQLTDPNDVRITTESGGLSKEWEYEINWLEPGDAIITGDIVERVPLHIRVRRRETRHGAPGFNPLDFVSPEERDKMKKRMLTLKDRLTKMRGAPGMPPSLPPSLPATYMPVKIDEKNILDILKEKRSIDHVEIVKSDLRYMPSLFAEVTVSSIRKTPALEFKDRLRRLIPVDSTLSIIDWRHESAYKLMANEVVEVGASSSPSRDGRHELPSAILFEVSGIESIKGQLKTFAISKLTQTIYFHKELGEYSRPGESMEEYKKRLYTKLEEIRKSRTSAITSSYTVKIKELDSSINATKDEYESMNKLVENIKEELKILNRERAKAEKEGRSLLKIHEQIQTREARLARLDKKIMELSTRISEYRRERERVERQMREEIGKVESETEALLEGPLQTLVFQPRHEEVEVEVLQVVWVPTIEALYRLYFDGVTKDFRLEWNGVNGRGIFGTCSECGVSLESLEGPLICFKCGELYCQDHLKVCSFCQRGICAEHAWSCQNCGRFYCKDEKPYLCSVCGKKLCALCISRCKECVEEVYCRDHLKECNVCKNLYCPDHYEVHVQKCSGCGKKLCVLEQVKCKICGRTFCKECSVKCSECGEEVCGNHSWQCSACGRVFCIVETQQKCSVCGKPLCKSCALLCSLCGNTVCAAHLNNCPDCKQEVCPRCIVEVKRFGLFKRTVCKNCANK
ncbi:MAG: helicase HerA domain-containing protein [Candidatus Methanomethylicaceae archaeon]